jgi:(+)-delta-cadinene 8-hydroxylase
MQRVQKELEDVVGLNQMVDEFHMPKLQYLDAVVKEVLRLHPPMPLLIPRYPSQTCTVAGYAIPKGTKIFVNAWAIQRDPQPWENPSDFKPERFLNEPGKWDFSANNLHYLPFGSGRRICVGIPIAEKMSMYLLASLFHSFNWQATESKDVDLLEKFGIVMRKAKPLMALPTKRLPNPEPYT